MFGLPSFPWLSLAAVSSFVVRTFFHRGLSESSERIRLYRLGWTVVGIAEFLNRHRDLSPVFLQLDEDELNENLAVQHDAGAFRGPDPRLPMRQPFLEIVVGLVLVAKTAHQSAASPRDLQRIECRLLHLRGPHRNGFQHLEEILATTMLAAFFVVCDQSGFISSSDLAHLDSSTELTGQALEKGSEIDSILAHVIDGQLFFTQDRLHVDDFHVECMFLNEGANDLDLLEGERFQGGPLIQVLNGRDPENPSIGPEGVVLSARRLDVVEHLGSSDRLATARIRAGRGEHLDEFSTSMRPSNHLGSATGLGVAAVWILRDVSHGADPDHDGRGGLELGVSLFVGNSVPLGRISIGFKDGKWKDRHG